jgi:SAM-dependent methyltransferase
MKISKITGSYPIISKDLLPFLTGEKISDEITIEIQRDRQIKKRLEFLENIARGKKIIHLGFADHLDLIEKKLKDNTWLHKRLCNSAKKCFGVDINREAVEFVKKLGITNVIFADIQNVIPSQISTEYWDYIILGEVLEHIDNPVLFLSNICDNLKKYCKRIIITVPNAFRFDNFKLAMKNLECINSDHRYWFTPYTLIKVILKAGIKLEDFYLCDSYKASIKRPLSFIRYFLLKHNPILRDNIVVVGNIV